MKILRKTLHTIYKLKNQTHLPRILLLVDRRGWAYDICARNLVSFQGDRFAFDIRYVRERPRLDLSRYDLLYVYFWGESYHQRYLKGSIKVIKEVSSHRWQDDPAYGPCSVSTFNDRYLHDASAVVCTSQRLYDMLAPGRPAVFYAQNGYDDTLFFNRDMRTADLVLGWAGNRLDTVKRVSELLEPAAEGYRLLTADGNRSRSGMNSFYNQVDVYVITSRHEGTPLPLLEAMAAGCFPVCTDVGVVPEVIQHGENGLIVDGTVESFRDAFAWCRANLPAVRAAGRRNALSIQSRRFGQTAKQFGDIIAQTLHPRDTDEN